jgi:hypothetical protein
MVNTTDKNITSTNSADAREQWFDDMVSGLRVDQLLMETGSLTKQKQDVYNAMISNDYNEVHDYARNLSSKYFIKNLIDTYFLSLAEYKRIPKKLGLELSNSKVLVWAEILNDDESTENALILSAAKANQEFSKFGFHISSTIVEEDDNLELPNHYKEVKIVID